MLNFNELEVKYGAVAAYQYLMEIEKAARIPRKMTSLDPETRLANAIHAQDALREPALMFAAA